MQCEVSLLRCVCVFKISPMVTINYIHNDPSISLEEKKDEITNIQKQSQLFTLSVMMLADNSIFQIL